MISVKRTHDLNALEFQLLLGQVPVLVFDLFQVLINRPMVATKVCVLVLRLDVFSAGGWLRPHELTQKAFLVGQGRRRFLNHEVALVEQIRVCIPESNKCKRKPQNTLGRKKKRVKEGV